MIEKILVPLDGSALSETALDMTREVLTGGWREVELIRVVPSVLQGAASFAAIGGTALVAPPWGDDEEEQVAEAFAYLESVARRLPRDVKVRPVVRLGDAAEEIVLRARQGGFDLIVMSTHGRTGLGRWVMGSVADNVIHRTAVPVLLVHPAIDRRRAEREETSRPTSASAAR